MIRCSASPDRPAIRAGVAARNHVSADRGGTALLPWTAHRRADHGWRRTTPGRHVAARPRRRHQRGRVGAAHPSRSRHLTNGRRDVECSTGRHESLGEFLRPVNESVRQHDGTFLAARCARRHRTDGSSIPDRVRRQRRADVRRRVRDGGPAALPRSIEELAIVRRWYERRSLVQAGQRGGWVLLTRITTICSC